MGIRKTVCTLCLLSVFLSSCTVVKDTEVPPNSDISSTCIMRYDVYQQGATTIEPDRFSVVMVNNPIDVRMYEERDDLGTTQEFRLLYSTYLAIWGDELSFSVSNLKTYLSDEEIERLDIAQTDWEKSIVSNTNLDRTIIDNHEVSTGLGTQHLSSSLLYLIDQYSTRVFHIKYLTYLVENYSTCPVLESEQMWNVFHEFGS